MVLMVMQKVATQAVNIIMVLSHIGSREMRGSSITRWEVIWPMASRSTKDAFTGVKSEETVSQQLILLLNWMIKSLMKATRTFRPTATKGVTECQLRLFFHPR